MIKIRKDSITSIALVLAIGFWSAVAVHPLAQAQVFKVLHDFSGGAEGAYPVAGLIMDTKGNLYGTTLFGGTGGAGTVYEVGVSGRQTVLYSFCARYGCPDGENPFGSLVRDAKGNLFGTTAYGGANFAGTVFKVDKAGSETVLYSFCVAGNCPDGAYPLAGLIRDSKGNFYGTTSFRNGAVFMLDRANNETVLHSFTGTPDGAEPFAGLARDPTGNLYGITSLGGASGYGSVFEVDHTGNESVLYSFSGSLDGGYPLYGFLVRDTADRLFGTTQNGGSSGLGVVFQVDKKGNQSVLNSFGGSNGAYPVAGLLRDGGGNFYGTTETGGAFGHGTVFRLNRTGKETVLHSFTGSDGSLPYAGLVQDGRGNLYGTTFEGGTHGYGTVFKLTP